MLRRSLILALFLAACHSGPTGPQAPPGIASVTLVTSTGTVFTGRALPGQRLVAQVLDSAGHAVTDAILTATASPGWTVHGDTVIAPSTEGPGTIRITASRTDPSSATSSPLTVAGVIDLRTLHLNGTVMCHYAPNVVMGGPNGTTFLDSIGYAYQIDSVHYVGDTSSYAGYLLGHYGGVGTLWTSGPHTQYLTPGGTYTTTSGYLVLALDAQVPDTLVFRPTGSITDTTRWRAVRTGTTVPAYPLADGRMLCDQDAGLTSASPTTITAH
jgi:hypothetical protein